MSFNFILVARFRDLLSMIGINFMTITNYVLLCAFTSQQNIVAAVSMKNGRMSGYQC